MGKTVDISQLVAWNQQLLPSLERELRKLEKIYAAAENDPTTLGYRPDDVTTPKLKAVAKRLLEDLQQSHSSGAVAITNADFCTQHSDFEIIDFLGRGGFGQVYLARQLSLDREVAIKITANLGREGRTMARMQHAHIVQVFSETVDLENDWRLLCMEYVPGASLQQIIRDFRKLDRSKRSGATFIDILDRLSTKPAILDRARLRKRAQLTQLDLEETVCWIGQQLAEALAYAHGKGILHRDIKPGNIMVNQFGQPLLSDFGLASDATDVASAILGGTAMYMSPEHRHACDSKDIGELAQVDARSDIYSLGAVLSELYHGNRPAAAENNAEFVATIEQSERPSSLARILKRCLETAL